MGRKKITAILLTAAITAAAGTVSGCGEKEIKLNRYDVQFLDLFDTVTSVVAYTEDEETFQAYAE